jgi:hypothetical protein
MIQDKQMPQNLYYSATNSRMLSQKGYSPLQVTKKNHSEFSEYVRISVPACRRLIRG